ncbi:hypothetical protein MES5069_280068 [Mesorhizobium escarrei]|uniref:Uncharacterized protein n=1 Tax=Mesorhizobium escarrei TaxID=666018 RepID=A0ABM9DX17_9HYPH|nr:hypothetical protein MES5069_280068 [Mesorhizobium escarrei]
MRRRRESLQPKKINSQGVASEAEARRLNGLGFDAEHRGGACYPSAASRSMKLPCGYAVRGSPAAGGRSRQSTS